MSRIHQALMVCLYLHNLSPGNLVCVDEAFARLFCKGMLTWVVACSSSFLPWIVTCSSFLLPKLLCGNCRGVPFSCGKRITFNENQQKPLLIQSSIHFVGRFIFHVGKELSSILFVHHSTLAFWRTPGQECSWAGPARVRSWPRLLQAEFGYVSRAH